MSAMALHDRGDAAPPAHVRVFIAGEDEPFDADKVGRPSHAISLSQGVPLKDFCYNMRYFTTPKVGSDSLKVDLSPCTWVSTPESSEMVLSARVNRGGGPNLRC